MFFIVNDYTTTVEMKKTAYSHSNVEMIEGTGTFSLRSYYM